VPGLSHHHTRKEPQETTPCLFAGDSGSYPPSAQAAVVFSRKPDLGASVPMM